MLYIFFLLFFKKDLFCNISERSLIGYTEWGKQVQEPGCSRELRHDTFKYMPKVHVISSTNKGNKQYGVLS